MNSNNKVVILNIMAKHFFKKVNGGYGDWFDFGACSVTCGEGVQERKRLCDNPSPQYGGESCEKLGPSVETKACQMKSCPGEDVTSHAC